MPVSTGWFRLTSGAIKEAVDILNQEEKNYGALLFGDIYPLPTQRLRHFAAQVVEIINVEQNATGQLAALLREEALINCEHGILKYDGRQLSVDDILTGIKNSREVSNMNNGTFTTSETAWCPGCGNYAILETLTGVLNQLETAPHQVVLVGGIGQAAKTNQYLTANASAVSLADPYQPRRRSKLPTMT